VKKRSVTAKALADKKYRQRIVLAKKGKGSYSRKSHLNKIGGMER